MEWYWIYLIICSGWGLLFTIATMWFHDFDSSSFDITEFTVLEVTFYGVLTILATALIFILASIFAPFTFFRATVNLFR